MKIIALVLAFSLAAAAPLAAQVASAGPGAEGPAETCPCSSPRFVAKTEKAKAVAAYWDARRGVKISAGIGGIALIFGAMARPYGGGSSQAQEAYGRAVDDMLAARAKAEKLGGLKVEGAGEDARVTVTLKKGVDYDLLGR